MSNPLSSESLPTSLPLNHTHRSHGGAPSTKRKVISSACMPCRKRKSKCDGALPACAACASVYGTECIYDPESDHRRKGVHRDTVSRKTHVSRFRPSKAQEQVLIGRFEGKKHILSHLPENASTKVTQTKVSTLQTIVDSLLNAKEDQAQHILQRIRGGGDLDEVAKELARGYATNQDDLLFSEPDVKDDQIIDFAEDDTNDDEGERDLARKMGELRMEDGNVRFIGGTSHLIYHSDSFDPVASPSQDPASLSSGTPITSWTDVTTDPSVIQHLLTLYFNYHYPYFATLSKTLFWQDFTKGRTAIANQPGTIYCSSVLVNTMLALGCHFTDIPEAYAIPSDAHSKGSHFFAAAKRQIFENDEFARPSLVNVQALALMSVHEAGCAREAEGWVYSGMAFRMAQDMGLNLEISKLDKAQMTEYEIDARKITFWGCFHFDKCWSNYLGRLPQLPGNSYSVGKLDVFPDEDSEIWRPYTDEGFQQQDQLEPKPARTRAIALQMTALGEISSELLIFFYHPGHIGRSYAKAVELKKLRELHQRLNEWREALPREFEPRNGQLPNVILMHMFFHLQYIHLFRPFLKYSPSTSPLPANISPRHICTTHAATISKLGRLYKDTYGLQQICNIAVYMLHSACTIHLLNLRNTKAMESAAEEGVSDATRDLEEGVKSLEHIASNWPCAGRSLLILSVLSRKWKCDVEGEVRGVFERADEKYGGYTVSIVPSPGSKGTPMVVSPESKASKDEPVSTQQTTQFTHQNVSSTRVEAPYDSITSQQGVSTFIHQHETLPMDPHTYPTQWIADPSSVPSQSLQTQMPNMITPVMAISQQPLQPHSAMPNIAMDSQEWFFNDSAQWYRGFEGWDGGQGGPFGLEQQYNVPIDLLADQQTVNDGGMGGADKLVYARPGGSWHAGVE